MTISDGIKAVAEPVNKLFVPLASSAGSTLQDAWELVFGGFGNYVEKKRIVRLKALEDFKNSLEEKVSAIPKDRLCEPKLSVVGPALDASKYYFEEPEIREMFAKLISASMDSEKSPSVHPSFAEIIKQMSPLDGQNLFLFIDRLPIAEYRLSNSNGDFAVACSNVFLENHSATDLLKQSQSISSLVRLGLIYTDYDKWLIDESRYEGFSQTPLYRSLIGGQMTLTFQKGLTGLTPLGAEFRRVCLS